MSSRFTQAIGALAAASILTWTPIAPGQTTWHVEDDAPPNGDGQSWETAFRFLADALSIVAAGDEIHMAGGTYLPDHDEAHPDGTQDRAATFSIPGGVTISGGYRGLGSNSTVILSGDLLNDDVGDRGLDDNSYHVVTIADATEPVVLGTINVERGMAIGDAGGGGFRIHRSEVQLTDCSINNNWGLNGGGIAAVESRITLTDCHLHDNRRSLVSGLGGAINCTRSRIRIVSSSVWRHSATKGGAIYGSDSDVELVSSEVLSNRAGSEGGAFWMRGGSLAIVDCMLEDNSSDRGPGGAGHFEQTSLRFSDSLWISNAVAGFDSAWVQGGAFFARNCNVQLERCTFDRCEAVGFNGREYSGGALYLDGGILTADDCYFSSCQAIGGSGEQTFGGAMAFSSASARLTDCRFVGNRAFVGEYADLAPGGAIYSRESAVQINRCRFTDNYALMGGALYFHLGTATVVNSLLSSNRARDRGSALYSYGVTPDFLNSTIVDNVGDVTMNRANLHNSIVWNNQPHELSATTIAYSNIQGGAPGEGNISSPPRFADPDLGDYRLLPASPGIDAGNNNALPPDILTDFAGQPRFADDTGMPDRGMGKKPITDMGAFEFQAATCWPDFNNDQIVNILDFIAFLNAYNANDLNADYTWDGQINSQDFLMFLNTYDIGCP